MQSSKRTISPLLYFILISSLTNIAFLIVSVVLLTIFSVNLSNIGILVIIFLMLWKGALVGFISWFWHRKTNIKDFLVKFIGIYLGRFFGILIGGFLGFEISDFLKQPTVIGSIVGALSLYFAGRWIGSKVSILMGNQLDKVFSIPESNEVGKIGDTKSSSRLVSASFFIYSLFFPLLFVVIGLLFNYLDVRIGYYPEILPISRIVVVVISIFSICSPWLLKNRWRNKYQTMTPLPGYMVYLLGLTLSIVPVFYGFVLFIGMGASIFELCFYALVSSIAAMLWSKNNKVSVNQNAS